MSIQSRIPINLIAIHANISNSHSNLYIFVLCVSLCVLILLKANTSRLSTIVACRNTSPYVPFKLLTFQLFIAWVPFQFIHCCNGTINLPRPSPELSNYLNQPIKWNDCWRGCCIAWWINLFFQAHRRNSELSDTTHHSGAIVGGGGSYCIRRSYKAWRIDHSCSPRNIMRCQGGAEKWKQEEGRS